MIRILLFGLLTTLAIPAFGSETPTLPEIKSTLESGHPNKAITQIDVLLSKNSDNPEARFLKGLILVNQNKVKEAIKIFEALTKDYPELPEPYNNLAVSYSALGRFDDARKALQSAITTHPSYATAHENLGNIYAMMAAEAYDHALSLDEQNTAARDKLALMSELFSIESINQPKVAAAPTVLNPTIDRVPDSTDAEDPELSMPLLAEVHDAELDINENPASDLENALLTTTLDWAAAWSNKDPDAYLSFYHNRFKPDKRMARSTWERQRRNRIAKPRFIEVEIIAPEITPIGADKAKIVFLQKYRSNTYRDEGLKLLQMEKTGGNWKIVRETSLQ